MVSRAAAVVLAIGASISWVSAYASAVSENDVKPGKESVSFQTRIERGKDVIVTQTMLLGPFRERKRLANGEIAIRDLARGLSVRLNPEERTAVRIRFRPTKDVNLYDHVCKVDVNRAERLKSKQLDGQTVDGLRIVDEQKHVTVKTTAWIDSKSKRPIQIERLWIAPNGKRAAKETLSKFVFDKELDESLFSLAIPEGYSVQQRQGLQPVFTPASD